MTFNPGIGAAIFPPLMGGVATGLANHTSSIELTLLCYLFCGRGDDGRRESYYCDTLVQAVKKACCSIYAYRNAFNNLHFRRLRKMFYKPCRIFDGQIRFRASIPLIPSSIGKVAQPV